MLTDAQIEEAARSLCRLMGGNPDNPRNFSAAEYDINLWLKCMQAVEQAEKTPP